MYIYTSSLCYRLRVYFITIYIRSILFPFLVSLEKSIMLRYLCIAKQFPAWMKKELQTFRGALQGEGSREEDHDQKERQGRCQVPHLRRWLNGLPDGKIYHDPCSYQARHELPSQNPRLFDAVANLQDLVAKWKSNYSFLKLRHALAFYGPLYGRHENQLF